MVFNPCTSIDLSPEFFLDGNDIQVVDEIRLLGLIITSDLKWTSNTENLVNKANKRLWILRRLKNLGASQSDLVDIYLKQIRCVLELAVPAWSGSINLADQIDLERIQKSTAHIILGRSYLSYKDALKTLSLDSLKTRRDILCLKFAKKAEQDKKFKHWLKAADHKQNTRQDKVKYCEVQAKHSRFKKSPLSVLTRMLNEYYIKK